jgi:MoxR-like ATPase
MGTSRISLEDFKEMCEDFYPGQTEYTKKEFLRVARERNITVPMKAYENKVYNGRPAKFSLVNDSMLSMAKIDKKEIIVNESGYDAYIPKKNDYFVSHGTNYKIINEVVKTKEFFPMYVYGVSGLGKTLQIEQACSINKRPFFRVQITKDTTNEDLIGCYSLVDGNTVWCDGPVLMAYRSGGILLLDEIDLNSSLMILQVVLENKPIYITQTGELVYPKSGFNVFATGNSKGDGTEARFVGTTILNDAFLERFVTIIEQKIPTIATEEKIIKRYMELEGITLDKEIYDSFIRWVDYVRQSYKDGNVEIYVSTRRVQYILKIYKVTKNFTKSIEVALARYPDEEVDSFMKYWAALYNEKSKA